MNVSGFVSVFLFYFEMRVLCPVLPHSCFLYLPCLDDLNGFHLCLIVVHACVYISPPLSPLCWCFWGCWFRSVDVVSVLLVSLLSDIFWCLRPFVFGGMVGSYLIVWCLSGSFYLWMFFVSSQTCVSFVFVAKGTKLIFLWFCILVFPCPTILCWIKSPFFVCLFVSVVCTWVLFPTQCDRTCFIWSNTHHYNSNQYLAVSPLACGISNSVGSLTIDLITSTSNWCTARGG